MLGERCGGQPDTGDGGLHVKTSPTQRTLARLRADGWLAQVVEHFNVFARRRQDLFGVADVIAVKAGSPILLVQTTTSSNLAARRTKVLASPAIAVWLSEQQDLFPDVEPSRPTVAVPPWAIDADLDGLLAAVMADGAPLAWAAARDRLEELDRLAVADEAERGLRCLPSTVATWMRAMSAWLVANERRLERVRPVLELYFSKSWKLDEASLPLWGLQEVLQFHDNVRDGVGLIAPYPMRAWLGREGLMPIDQALLDEIDSYEELCKEAAKLESPEGLRVSVSRANPPWGTGAIPRMPVFIAAIPDPDELM
jgi:hypothetical protein